MPWGYLSGKNGKIQHKKLIYTIYTTQCFYKVSGKNVSYLSVVWIEWAINEKKVLWAQKKPNIPGVDGDKEANSQYHRNCQEWLL